MTNREFTKTPLFKTACSLCFADKFPKEDKFAWSTIATVRQASKFRRKTGIVYGYKKMAKVMLQNETTIQSNS